MASGVPLRCVGAGMGEMYHPVGQQLCSCYLQVTSAGCAMLCARKSFLAVSNVLDLQTIGFCGLEELVATIKPVFRSFSNQTGCLCLLSILVDPDRYKVSKVNQE